MGNLHTVGHIFNPLTTDDAFWHCLTLAVYYQLGQSVLKISFVLAKKVVTTLAGCRTAMVATGWIIFQHVSTNGQKLL